MAAPITAAPNPVAYRAKVYLLRLAALGALVGWWIWSTGPGDVSPLVLPRLPDVWRELVAFSTSAEVYRALRITAATMFAALAISTAAGFVVGFWGARTERRADVLEPILIWGYLIPTVLFYPLFILWFGIGPSSKVVYAAQSAFFPIAFNCLRGFRNVDERFVRVGRAFGASSIQLDWLIKLRAGMPVAAAGVRLGAALCMITVIVAEMLASRAGLGYLLRYYSSSFSTAKSYAIIVVILVIVGVFHAITKRLLPDGRLAR